MALKMFQIFVISWNRNKQIKTIKAPQNKSPDVLKCLYEHQFTEIKFKL